MKVLFAIYDNEDNFINCGFTLAEIGVKHTDSWFWQHRNKKIKLFRIPLEPQDDIFREEDEVFIQEFKEQCYTHKEYAALLNTSERNVYGLLEGKRKLKKVRERLIEADEKEKEREK